MSVPLVRLDDRPPPAEDARGADEPDAEGPWVPAVEPDAVPPEPVRPVVAEASVAATPEAVPEGPPAPEPGPERAGGAGSAADGRAAAGTRYCGLCGERVPVEADGLRCYLGHRLSPAHAARGGWLRRLLRRG